MSDSNIGLADRWGRPGRPPNEIRDAVIEAQSADKGPDGLTDRQRTLNYSRQEDGTLLNERGKPVDERGIPLDREGIPLDFEIPGRCNAIVAYADVVNQRCRRRPKAGRSHCNLHLSELEKLADEHGLGSEEEFELRVRERLASDDLLDLRWEIAEAKELHEDFVKEARSGRMAVKASDMSTIVGNLKLLAQLNNAYIDLAHTKNKPLTQADLEMVGNAFEACLMMISDRDLRKRVKETFREFVYKLIDEPKSFIFLGIPVGFESELTVKRLIPGAHEVVYLGLDDWPRLMKEINEWRKGVDDHHKLQSSEEGQGQRQE